jgi:hypothetical protein
MIPKPDKLLEHASSCRPISLLEIMRKIFEKAMLKSLCPILEENRILLDHQFGFQYKHSTIEQAYWITQIIRGTLQKKEYCSAAFLDITQAFDKIRHPGLLFKIQKILPHAYYRILQPYLTDTLFQVEFKDENTTFRRAEARIQQGSVIGPVLYLIYTSDLPTSDNTTATFTDDRAILATHEDPAITSMKLQATINKIGD